MNEYSIALDAQVEWASYWTSPEGLRMFEAILRRTSAERERMGEKLANQILKTGHDELVISVMSLFNGDCFYWSREMVDIVKAAAESLPDNWSLMKAHIPSVSGFFYLGKEVEHLAGIGWTVISFEAEDRDKLEKPIAMHLPRDDGEFPDFNGLCLVFFDRNPSIPYPIPARGSLYVGESLREWKMHVVKHATRLNADINEFSDNMTGTYLFAAMLSFLQQRVMVTTRQRAVRATRKRVERMQRQSAPDINVVRLRSVSYPVGKGEPAEVDWQCRWIVHGHWRNQWYSTEGKHHPVFINPYIKGPEGKPLKDPKKLFAVVR